MPSCSLGRALLLLALLSTPSRAEEGAGVVQRQLTFESRGARLAASLLLPPGGEPHPAIVLLHGSGRAGRDDASLRAIGRAFSEEGFAVLLSDKRGTGDSGGDFETAGFELLASDALAAIELLEKRSDISGVGVWGKSQGGGWIAPLVASREHELAFAISFSGPAESLESYMHRFLRRRLQAEQGFDRITLDRIDAVRRTLWSYLSGAASYERASEALEGVRSEPWFDQAGLPGTLRPASELGDLPASTRTFLGDKDFDPLAVLARNRVPFLAVYGEADEKLPISEYARRLTAIDGVTVRLCPGIGHDLGSDVADREDARDCLAEMISWAGARVAESTTSASDTATGD